MQRAFQLLHHLGDIVERQPRLEIADIAHCYSECLTLGRCRPAYCQSATQRFIDNVAEWTPGTARFRLQLGGHIIIEREGRPHALMLGVSIMMSRTLNSP